MLHHRRAWPNVTKHTCSSSDWLSVVSSTWSSLVLLMMSPQVTHHVTKLSGHEAVDRK